MLPLVIALSARDQELEHTPSYAPGGRSAPDIALSRSGRLYGDRGRHGADASAGSGGFDSRCVAALPAQPRRPDGQNCVKIVNQSTANRTLFICAPSMKFARRLRSGTKERTETHGSTPTTL